MDPPDNHSKLNANRVQARRILSAHLSSPMRFVSVHIQGGLGNQLFQLLFGLAQARRFGVEFRITSASPNPHSRTDYFAGIFACFRPFVKPPSRIDKVVRERPEDVWRIVEYDNPFVDGVHGVLYYGYFQSFSHFEHTFNRRQLNEMLGTTEAKERIGGIYPAALTRGLFVHIRRGDYKSAAHSVHDLDLQAYYDRALDAAREIVRGDFQVFVVSDDIEHCRKDDKLKACKDVVFVNNLNEVDTLYLMALCRYGGICANSTFSWFGAYLNENADKFVSLPSRWWRLESCLDGLYFKGACRISV